MIAETPQSHWWERDILCVSIWTTLLCSFSPSSPRHKMNVFAPAMFLPHGQMRGLSLGPFYFHNFTVCFPCWDILWISQCCSFLEDHIWIACVMLSTSPSIPKIREGKGGSCPVPQVCFSGGLCARFKTRSGGWQWAGEGLEGLPCCTFSPSAKFGSLQALLLNFSHLLGFLCFSA